MALIDTQNINVTTGHCAHHQGARAEIGEHRLFLCVDDASSDAAALRDLRCCGSSRLPALEAVLLFPAFAAAVGIHSSFFWRLGTDVWIYTFPDEPECGIWIQTLKPNLRRNPLCTALNFEFKSFQTTQVEARRQSLFAPRWVQQG